MLKEIIANFKNQYDHLTINLSLDSNMKELFIQGNQLIKEVLENLIINGIKHNNSYDVEINIRISKEKVDQIPHVKIEIIDNGVGIEETRKQSIFQSSGRGIKKGMGLGLSLVKKIMEMYHGIIRVENRIPDDYSKGSNFILLIPTN